MARPPYFRYVAAAMLLAAAAWMEFAPTPTVAHPFAGEDLPAGTRLDGADLEWRTVPAGLLPEVDDDAVTVRRVAAGDPVVAGDLEGPDNVAVPDDWWHIDLPMPGEVHPGDRLLIVVRSPDPSQDPNTVRGMVVRPPAGSSPLALGDAIGTAAIPDGAAAAVAAAASDRRITVLVDPSG